MNHRKRLIVACVVLGLTLVEAPAYLLGVVAARERLNGRLLTAIHAVDAMRVNSLLSEGADPNTQEGGNVTPGPVAAIMRALGLLRKPLPDSTNGETALQLALDSDISTPLVADIERTRVFARETMAVALIDRGADPNRYHFLDQPPLGNAAALGMTSVVELMLKHGARVDAADFFGNTPLMECRSDEVARLLIQGGANPNWRSREGFTPLLQECRGYYGTPSLGKVRKLLAAGADVNAVYYETETRLSGQTSLMLAARDAASPVSASLVSMLLSHGANAGMIDSDRHNALYYAMHPDDDDVPAATKLRLAHLISQHMQSAKHN